MFMIKSSVFFLLLSWNTSSSLISKHFTSKGHKILIKNIVYFDAKLSFFLGITLDYLGTFGE